MTKQKLLAVLLSATLLFTAVAGLGLTVTAETDWQEGTNGVGQYAAIDQAGYTALGTSLIAGKTPAKKDGTAYSGVAAALTDGTLSTNDDYAEFKDYRNQWAYLRFDLGGVYDIDNLVVGSPVRSDSNDSWTLRWFRVYVSDNAATLYDAANLVAQVDKVATKNAQLQVQPEGGKATGQYVGFAFWVPSVDGNWRTANPFNAEGDMYTLPNINYKNDGSNLAGQCWGALQIGELGIFGQKASAWKDGTNGVGRYQPIDQAGYTALGTSLIAGKTPDKKDGSAYTGVDASITDGLLSTNWDFAEFKLGAYNTWGYLQFDLGAVYDIDNLLVGSPVRDGTAWNLRWFRVYVSNDAATLFEDANLVARADKLSDAYAQVQVQPEGGKATGQYVGFRFWVPSKSNNQAFDSSKELYEFPNINYNNDGSLMIGECYGALQIGELGIFGQKASAWKEGTNGVGQYQPIDQAGYTALGNSLIAGKTPTKKDGAAFAFDVSSALTDGKLSAGDDYAEFTAYYNTWAYLRFDLGAVYDIDNLLVGSPVRSDGSKAWNLRWFRVYVSDKAADLYDAANLVTQTDRLADTYAQVQVQPDGGKATGRYVGFAFWVPHTSPEWQAENAFDANGDMFAAPNINYTTDGTIMNNRCWGALEIGELGVFGKRVTLVSEGAQIRGNKNDLRFGFTLACNGVAYAAADSFVGDYSNATVIVDGKNYTISKVGTVMAIKAAVTDTAIELADVDEKKVKDVPATKVYTIGEDSITYTAVAVNIPEAHLESAILARPYVIYEDENNAEVVLYGDVLERSYAQISNGSDFKW